MSLYSVLGFSVLHMPTHLVLTNDSPEISRPAGGQWRRESHPRRGLKEPPRSQAAIPSLSLCKEFPFLPCIRAGFHRGRRGSQEAPVPKNLILSCLKSYN